MNCKNRKIDCLQSFVTIDLLQKSAEFSSFYFYEPRGYFLYVGNRVSVIKLQFGRKRNPKFELIIKKFKICILQVFSFFHKRSPPT